RSPLIIGDLDAYPQLPRTTGAPTLNSEEPSKEQLDLARDSEVRTQSALDEIRRLSQENRDLAAGVKSDIDTRINKFLDQQVARLEQETVS
ncbi:hypothetical protein O6482_25040, partial [Salmonella enterica subsp. enterica]